jgi:hypothetical protein
LDFVFAGAFGGILGAGELVARYRDEPGRAVQTGPGIFYTFLNVIVGALALTVIRTFGIAFTPTGATGAEAGRLAQILVAGLGGMVFFRSSVFTLRVGSQDVALGPGGILQVILSAADSGVDRLRAESRDSVVQKHMSGVSFSKASEALHASSSCKMCPKRTKPAVWTKSADSGMSRWRYP